jgi:hypothetical protein
MCFLIICGPDLYPFLLCLLSAENVIGLLKCIGFDLLKCIGSRFLSFLFFFTNLYAVGSRFVSFFDLFVVCREPNWFVLFICIGFGLYALGPMWFVLFTPYICSGVPMHYFFAIDFGALLDPYLICLCIG